MKYGLLVFSLLALATPAFAQLDPTLAAHGGLAEWRSYGGLEFDLTWKNAKGTRQDHELFDLHRRSALITSDHYTLGRNGNEVWIEPGLDALGGIPPRFYVGTPFYFFGMPFVFADPGVKQQSLGKKRFQGKEYDAVGITFAKGIGDTSEDHYVAYLDPKSARLELVEYVVTYPAMRKGRALSNLEPHAIVFSQWQQVDGLLVPKVASFYKWTGSDIEGKALGRLEFSQVHFDKQAPDESKFKKPAGAVTAPM